MVCRIVIFIVLSSSMMVAQAQNKGAKLIFGVAATQVDGDRMGGFNKLGVIIGASVVSPLENDFYFEPELIYFQKGSSQGASTRAVLNLKYHYLELPLLFGRNVTENIHLQAGPSIGYLFKALGNVGGRDENILNDMRKLDVNVAIGGGYRLSEKWLIKVRYAYSVLSVSKIGIQRNSTVGFLFEYVL